MPQISQLRRFAVPITGTAMVAGMLLIGTPASAAISTTGFKTACVAGSIIGDVHKVTDNLITVDAPASVQPGETFTYRIQPSGTSYPDKDSGATTTNLSRLKVDYAIPANATFVSAAVVAGTSVGLDSVAPNVLRVNDSGNVDGSGGILRLSGNNQVIGNSPTTSTNSEGGIRVPKSKKNLDGSTNGNGDTWFRLPAVDVTMVAGATGVIQPKVRTAGTAGNLGASENFSTQLAKASFLGTQWAPTRCSPRENKDTTPLNAGAGPLATISIASAPVDVETTTSLSVPATAITGAAVDLTATVAPNNAVGTVQFKSNGTAIGSPVTVTSGVATLSHAFDAAGAQSVTADFSAGAGFVSSSASAQTVTVSDPAPVDVETTTSLSVPATAITGAAVDLTATVAPNNAVGTVQFKSNGTAIGSPVTVSGGTATLSHSFDAAGAQSVTADFIAGAGFVGSSASAQTVTVSDPAPVDVETTTSLSVPATAITGAAVDLTATVAPNNAVGTVQFKSNGTAIGTPVTVTSGVATLSHSFDAAGAQSVTADFTAGAGFVSSSASAQTVTVSDPAPVDVETTTSLSVPATAITGAAVDLTATVAPNSAVGTVQFKSNGTAIGSPVTVTGGVATLSHAFDAAGAQSVTADFTAGAGFVSSSASARTVTVSDPAPVDVETTTSLSVPATATTGAAVDLTATVAPNNAVGTVQFKSNGTAIGSPVTVSGGTATLSHIFDAAGAQSITADFTAGSGFKNSVASAKSVQVSVADQESVVELNIPTDAKTGVATDLWATVRTSSDDAVGVGTVQFYDGGVAIGGPEPVTAGAAGLSHTFTSAGAHSITAVYSGGAGVVGSSAQARTVNVTDPAPSDVTTETVVTVPADGVVNKSVTLSATVSSVQNGGTVQFMDGDTPIGDAAAVVNGIAALNHTFTTTGAHSISAIYSGAAGFTGSTSAAHAIQIKAATGGGTGSLGSGSAGSSDFLPFGS
ncbi:beta strand repeat-containing protein [Rhodococcus sp. 5A-K4]|uniref:beta strand repeat-containing protein n=1 Tax=Rhodococcus sp. 5A-K4 TaxID=3384442 RepID=UPI0038D3D350